ncbi:tetratricopeptide repeat protein [Pseudomonadota bacterium]
MSATGSNIQQMTQASFSALQAGDGNRAKIGFEQIIATGQADTMHWLGLAFACSRLGDKVKALSALDKSLELQPRNLRAVLYKAELLTQQGQSRPALQHYKYAMQLAENAPDLPPDIRQDLVKAEKACAEQEKEYRSFLLDRLQADGFIPGESHPRFRQSLDLIFGDKQIFYQQPRRFYYPGLPQIQFYEREQKPSRPRQIGSGRN